MDRKYALEYDRTWLETQSRLLAVMCLWARSTDSGPQLCIGEKENKNNHISVERKHSS